jgi:hypothetical protein
MSTLKSQNQIVFDGFIGFGNNDDGDLKINGY